jgi:hypothetical protein
MSKCRSVVQASGLALLLGVESRPLACPRGVEDENPSARRHASAEGGEQHVLLILRQITQEKTNEGEVERRMIEWKLQHIATNHQGSFTDAQGRYLLPTFVNHRP